MPGKPMNIPRIPIATAKAALIEQFACPVLRRRATMLQGARGRASRRSRARWRGTTASRWST